MIDKSENGKASAPTRGEKSRQNKEREKAKGKGKGKLADRLRWSLVVDLDTYHFRSDAKGDPVAKRNGIVDPFAAYPRAVLAPEIFNRNVAASGNQPGVMTRNRIGINANGALTAPTDHGLARRHLNRLLTPDESTDGNGGSRCSSGGHGRSRKCITDPMHGTNQPTIVSRVAERPPKLRDQRRKTRFRDVHPRPEGRAQLLVSHGIGLVFYEDEKQVERLWREVDVRSFSLHQPCTNVDDDRTHVVPFTELYEASDRLRLVTPLSDR